jgi:hypothetical protein
MYFLRVIEISWYLRIEKYGTVVWSKNLLELNLHRLYSLGAELSSLNKNVVLILFFS